MNEKFIVLLRHGIAEPHGSRTDDDARELTRAGHRRMKEIAKGLHEIFPKAESIHSSPLIRCKQTAEWVAKAYGRQLEVSLTDALRPDAGPDAGRAFIEQLGERRAICVGHEPGLSELMLAITGLHATGPVELKKGGCYGIRIAEDGAAQLKWMLPPRALRT
jgi:phosphohistidine phosphatase